MRNDAIRMSIIICMIQYLFLFLFYHLLSTEMYAGILIGMVIGLINSITQEKLKG